MWVGSMQVAISENLSNGFFKLHFTLNPMEFTCFWCFCFLCLWQQFEVEREQWPPTFSGRVAFLEHKEHKLTPTCKAPGCSQENSCYSFSRNFPTFLIDLVRNFALMCSLRWVFEMSINSVMSQKPPILKTQTHETPIIPFLLLFQKDTLLTDILWTAKG